ncbi:DUF2931 family protein [Pseudomonas sp. NFX98]|uniref:DUF2931 family protein n=1 Tax=Pseudomonas sp. NFX98 TaxID=3399122 RepID=UPI0039FD2C3D
MAVLLFGLLLSGCAQSTAQSSDHKGWFLGFGAPAYMEVLIETADIVDIHEQLLRTAVAGIASVQTPGNNKGKPAGWPENPGSGAGHYIRQVDLPRLIYVRWQSLAEPQTYEAYIVIPESAREIMREPQKVFCEADGKWITEFRSKIAIGLAPGGIAKVWLRGACLNSIEIVRVDGKIYPKGPYGGKSGGKHRPLTETSKAYIEKFGIPYGSW